jgi:hypothetical protein
VAATKRTTRSATSGNQVRRLVHNPERRLSVHATKAQPVQRHQAHALAQPFELGEEILPQAEENLVRMLAEGELPGLVRIVI